MANQGNMRGGSHGQPSKAGQSQKNEDKGGKSGQVGSTRGGTSEQHAEAGRQSHKNDQKGGSSGSNSR